MKSTIRTNILAAAFLVIASLSGCKSYESDEVSLLPGVDEILNDESSVYHVDFSVFPESLKSLPIGVICAENQYNRISEQVISLEAVDNITGEPAADDILDFGGEHFMVLELRDSLPGMSAEELNLRAVQAAAILLRNEYEGLVKQPVKFILICDTLLTRHGMESVRQIIQLSGKEIGVLGINDSADVTKVATECYNTLRGSRNLALRITPQETTVIIDPAPAVEIPADTTTTEECIQQK